MAQVQPMERLLTIKEAATLLGCHRSTLIRWDKLGMLIPVRVGTRKDRRYKLSEIEKIVAEGGLNE